MKVLCLVFIVSSIVTPVYTFAATQEGTGPHTNSWQERSRQLLQSEITNGDSSQRTEPWQTVKDLPERQLGLNIIGDVPWLLPAFGETYYLINEYIENLVDDILADARRARARSVTFSYEVYPTQDLVSILIQATVSSVISRTLVRSVNFCPYTGTLMTIHEALDFDIVPLAVRILDERMRRFPERFYAAQAVSIAEQAFFVNDQGITILFDEFQLSSIVSGIITLSLDNDSIRTATLLPEQLLPTNDAYNLVMVPVRYISGQLGYNVNWNNTLQRAELRLNIDGELQVLAWMTPNINEYRTAEFARSLEAAPVNIGGHTFVPISFFDQVLPLTVYTIDSYGKITFLAYLG